MSADATHKVRVTGILLENDRVLLVKQRISARREWSLPGGTVEVGETLVEACRREVWEETGLDTSVESLAFLAHRTDPPLFDAGFRLSRVGGTIRVPPPEFEDNLISDVAFFFVNQLETMGFGGAFVDFLRSLDDLPAPGVPFVGAKEAIGLEAALPELAGVQGFEEVGQGPDVDAVRGPHAA